MIDAVAEEALDAARALLARMLVMATFCAWLIIRTKTGSLVTFQRDRWFSEQAQFEDERTGMDLVLKGRQIGFTTIELARDVQYIATHLGVQVVIVAHTLQAKRGIFGIVRRFVDGLIERGLLPEADFNTVDQIEFSSRASSIRVIEAGATEVSADDKGRSGTINRLHLTELAFYREPGATLKALRGAMPKDGTAEVVIESTPNGAAGLFYDMVKDALAGRGPYKLHFYPWFKHAEYRLAEVPADFDPTPRDEWEQRLFALGCNVSQLAWWRQRVDARDEGGLEGALQEYPIDALSCFRLLSGAYLKNDVVDFIASNVVKPIRTERVKVRIAIDGVPEAKWPTRDMGEVLIFADPVDGASYVVPGDTAAGGGGDSDALVARVRDRRTFRLMASFKSNTITPGDFGLVMAWLGRKYGNALAIPERNNDGGTTIDRMTTERTDCTPYRNIYATSDGKLGWLTSTTTRPIMWGDWHDAVRAAKDSGEARGWFDVDLANEARTLVLKGGRPEAQHGAHDDVWSADAIGWQAKTRVVQTRGGGQRQSQSGQGNQFEGV